MSRRSMTFALIAMGVLVAAATFVSLRSPPWPAHDPPGPAWMFPVWLLVGLVLGACGLVLGLAAGAIALVVGLAFAAFGLAMALSFLAVPIGLVVLVVWLLVRDRRPAAQRTGVVDVPGRPPGGQP